MGYDSLVRVHDGSNFAWLCGNKVVKTRLWKQGCGNKVVETRLWKQGCGNKGGNGHVNSKLLGPGDFKNFQQKKGRTSSTSVKGACDLLLCFESKHFSQSHLQIYFC